MYIVCTKGVAHQNGTDSEGWCHRQESTSPYKPDTLIESSSHHLLHITEQCLTHMLLRKVPGGGWTWFRRVGLKTLTRFCYLTVEGAQDIVDSNYTNLTKPPWYSKGYSGGEKILQFERGSPATRSVFTTFNMLLPLLSFVQGKQITSILLLSHTFTEYVEQVGGRWLEPMLCEPMIARYTRTQARTWCPPLDQCFLL